jgi:integrase
VARGEDPSAEWGKAREEMTVADLFDHVWATHWKKGRYANSGWANDVRANWKNHIEPTFGALKLSSVEPSRVRAWHSGFEDIPFAGNRSLEVLKKMFSRAEEDGIIARDSNPCWRVTAFPEKKRNRYATPAEIGRIVQILEREKDVRPVECAFFYLVMFTGSRPIAIEKAKWKELKRVTVEGENYGVLTFEGKSSFDSGEDETVIVPPVAMRVIDSLPRRTDGRIVGIRTPNSFWERIRKEAGCEDLWARDLRRTFATVGMSGGVNKDVIGKLLNHSASQTTDIYAKLDMSARIEAAGRIASMVTDISNISPLH